MRLDAVGAAAPAAFALMLAALPAAAEEPLHTYFCHVSQPMVSRDERRVEIHDVTYVLKLLNPVPGIEIQLTSQPGPVILRAEQDADTVATSEIVNLNVANLMGLRIEVEKRPPGTWNADPDTSAESRGGGRTRPRFYISELGIDLDVSALARQRRHAGEGPAGREELAQFDALVAATVECILENARRSRPPIRSLRLEVAGWDRYRHLSKVYPVAEPREAKVFRY